MRGRPVVINFFASWCAPCKAEGAAFADAADAYSGRVQFVGVAIDDSRAGALSYTHHYGWNWPIVFDPHDHLVGAVRPDRQADDVRARRRTAAWRGSSSAS